MENPKLRKERRRLNKKVKELFSEESGDDSLPQIKRHKYHLEVDLQSNSNREEDSDDNSDFGDTDIEHFYTDYDFETDLGCDRDSSSSSSSSSGESTEFLEETAIQDTEDSFTKQLANWSALSGCSREKLNDLLSILRTSGRQLELPKDARTLLCTPRKISASLKCGGTYVYVGIFEGITYTFALYPNIKNCDTLELEVNIDGLPLSRSSKSQLWPILASLNGSDHVFSIAIFHGYSKPNSVDEFLCDFINDCKSCMENGVEVDGKHYRFGLKAIICDAPARSFLKCIIAHTGYHACERCENKGETIQKRRVFNTTVGNKNLRTDKEFNEMKYSPEHQKSSSPLTLLSFKCVSKIPLDYMHLVLLGVVKRMLAYLKNGPTICRLSNKNVQEISEKLISFNGLLPSEFSRQPRSLDDFGYWKATEFRQFLLYTGVIAMRSVV